MPARRFQKYEQRSCGNPGEMAARMERHMPEGIKVLPGQAQMISRVMSGGEQDMSNLVYEIWPQKSREWRRLRRIRMWDTVVKLHATLFLKVERLIASEDEEETGCARQECPCEATYNRRKGEYCCTTCKNGTPCMHNYHRKL